MEEEITYKHTDLFTITEVKYSDGLIRYEINSKRNKDGSFSSSAGMYNDIDLMVEILMRIGKIGKDTKVYVSK